MTTNEETKVTSTAMENSIEQEDELVQDLDEVAEVIPFTYSITAYGADYPVDSLVKRIKKGDILVPTVR